MSRSAAPTPSGMRLDIQGLRSLAVGLVIGYHIYPGRLPGGFIGVDIFLVISGFLIVGSLVRGISKTGTVNLATFYARRIRRLLPASALVLLAVMVATVLVLPQGRWQGVARDVVASALQIQNWNQAFGLTSYESAGALVSPVQHFWSLAVEEQFYLVIPLLLILAVMGGRLLKLKAETACLWFLVLITTVSLFHSVLFSFQNHDVAYFATTTRIWELAVGGIAALVLPAIHFSSVTKLVVGWLGLIMVLFAAVAFQTSMAFPGYIAILPVVGTVLIIAAGEPENPESTMIRFGFSRCLSLQPFKYLGDISYSLYLWHWPVIVFYILIRGHEPGLAGGVGIMALSIVLASLSYHQIEQRFRSGRLSRQKDGRRYRPEVRNRQAFGLASMLVVLSCVAAVGPWAMVEIKSLQLFAQDVSPDYPGAMAFDSTMPARVPPGVAVKPDPAIATKDAPLTFKDGCGVYDPAKFTDSECHYGNPSGRTEIVLVGDSHAGQYVDPLVAIANERGWQVRAMVRNGCPFSAVPPSSVTTTYTNCSAQNSVTLGKILAMKPLRVVVSGMSPYGYEKALRWGWVSNQALVDGYTQMLEPLRAAGIQVLVIADTPYPEFSTPDCVARNGAVAVACRIAKQVMPDPLLAAAKKIGGIHMLDLSSYLCKEELCPAVVGNVLVFRDNHLTATFAKTLESPIEGALRLP